MVIFSNDNISNNNKTCVFVYQIEKELLDTLKEYEEIYLGIHSSNDKINILINIDIILN